jgi:type II secretory pathway pseudopilin PulG
MGRMENPNPNTLAAQPGDEAQATSPEGASAPTLQVRTDVRAPQPAQAETLKVNTGKMKAEGQSNRKRSRWPLAILLGLLGLLLIAALSGFGGYQQGIALRQEAETTQVAASLQEQYDLGVQDLAAGNFFRAQQRLEYVLQHDPNYPGVIDNLTKAKAALSVTITPTTVPTPTVTPTPDSRDSEQKFSAAQQMMQNSQWVEAIDTLLMLRKSDPQAHAIEVDGMLYLAYRNMGIDKVKKANLEGGIYDLTLASRFGPLDSEAQGYLAWSSQYLTAASFWGVNWEEVINRFSEIAAQLPNLMDGSGMTARERLRQGYIGYAVALAGGGDCDRAGAMLAEAVNMGADYLTEQADGQIFQICSQQPEPEKKKNKTPSPGGDQQPTPPPEVSPPPYPYPVP